MILKEISQQYAVLYSDWSLQMGQVGPKMTLGTLLKYDFFTQKLKMLFDWTTSHVLDLARG